MFLQLPNKLGWRIPGEPAERVRSGAGHPVRGVRGGSRRVLVLRRGPVLVRRGADDRPPTRHLLAGLLELHQPGLLAGNFLFHFTN